MVRPLSTRLLLCALCIAAIACTNASADDSTSKASDEHEHPAQAHDKNAATAKLPLKKVVLYSAGVGFFQHSGKVKGDATVNMKFNVRDINDLLKSMVLEDLDGGRVSTITYGSKDPITKTLQTFAIDLTSNPTLGQILNQIRGEHIEIDAQQTTRGVILGVEKQTKKVGDKGETVEIELLNLLTPDGMRRIPLDSIGRIRLSNAKLDAELRQALEVLALGHATDKKTVALNFLGQGDRSVRVGYIQESPIWKTSYRLVLEDGKTGFLQGWALVENTTEDDWKDVALTLVSGRPISFIMDLYQPLYLKRPTVQPELFASLGPQVYGKNMNADFDAPVELAESAPRAAEPADAMAAHDRRTRNGHGAAFARGRGMGGFGGSLGLDGATMKAETLGVTGQSMAQAAELGELFQYVISTPVNLPRQQSAMLPIVNGSVKTEKVSIYNRNVQTKHPLNGLRLSNSTDLHLMQGPITVFDEGAYAGDARIEDLQPGAERLVSYALDLDTEVVPTTKTPPEQLLEVRITKGILQLKRKYMRENEFKVKNSGKRTKKVLVEHPIEKPWELVAPKKADETSRDMYRFNVQVAPGKTTTLNVEEEQISRQAVALTNMDDGTIIYYANHRTTTPEAKKALQEVLERKSQLARVVQNKQRLESNINTISQEQQRIRQNMAQLDRNTDLYNRYVKMFSQQEDQIGELRKRIEQLTDEETGLRRALDQYLSNLTL